MLVIPTPLLSEPTQRETGASTQDHTTASSALTTGFGNVPVFAGIQTAAKPTALGRDLTRRLRTLVFCTAYVGAHAGSCDTWERRYAIWRRAITAARFRYDQVLIIDDASPSPPAWPSVEVLHEGDSLQSRSSRVMFRFARHLGRRGVSDFPGWVRSFFFAARYAAVNGFEKVVHLESDAFLISDRMQAFVDEIREGWVAPLCPRYRRPESAIQVIAGSAMSKFQEMGRRNVEELAGVVIEDALPFTHIETSFYGDRFGEYLSHIPREADWAAQTVAPLEASPETFYWWISARSADQQAAK